MDRLYSIGSSALCLPTEAQKLNAALAGAVLANTRFKQAIPQLPEFVHYSLAGMASYLFEAMGRGMIIGGWYQFYCSAMYANLGALVSGTAGFGGPNVMKGGIGALMQ